MGALFTYNQKTILSLDFDRQSTCYQFCDYCYVDGMERLYPSYLNKIEKNSTKVTSKPSMMADQLNDEYSKYRRSRSKQFSRLDKVPVRIYGSGDYIPIHFNLLKKLNFKYFIISKNLTQKNMSLEIVKLLSLPELTTLVLSFDEQNMDTYDNVKSLYNKDRIKFAFTGLADDFQEWKKDYNFDIFFNISKKKLEKEKSLTHKEHCPCDSGVMKLQKSCTFCSKCWRSSKTKGKEWNVIN